MSRLCLPAQIDEPLCHHYRVGEWPLKVGRRRFCHFVGSRMGQPHRVFVWPKTRPDHKQSAALCPIRERTVCDVPMMLASNIEKALEPTGIRRLEQRLGLSDMC